MFYGKNGKSALSTNSSTSNTFDKSACNFLLQTRSRFVIGWKGALPGSCTPSILSWCLIEAGFKQLLLICIKNGIRELFSKDSHAHETGA